MDPTNHRLKILKQNFQKVPQSKNLSHTGNYFFDVSFFCSFLFLIKKNLLKYS